MSFVKLSIFGTSFEVRLQHFAKLTAISDVVQVTTRYVDLQPVGMGEYPLYLTEHGGAHQPFQGAFGLVWYVTIYAALHLGLRLALRSSAKDQLTQQPVAIKKIMKPFSTPVLSKRTYRELKLLKHIQHENVRMPLIAFVSADV